MIVLSLCDRSGRMAEPWAEAGCECYCIDLQHEGKSSQGNIHFIGANIHDCVSKWLPLCKPIIAFAFPPCTHTAVSGAKYFQSKGPQGAAEAFSLIARCQGILEWLGCPYLWEQPVATTSTYCGKPNHTFNPSDFAGYLPDPQAEAYTKKTCIWSKGITWPEPMAVEAIKVCEQGSWVQKLGGASARTKNLRSQTPRGFARAIFEANKHLMNGGV